MTVPLTIKFHNVRSTSAVESAIRKHVERLEALYNRMTSCGVVIDRPHNQHQCGNRFSIRIQMNVPGKPLVIHAESKEKGDFVDLQKALKHAFSSAEKALKSYKNKRKRRRETKLIENPNPAFG